MQCDYTPYYLRPYFWLLIFTIILFIVFIALVETNMTFTTTSFMSKGIWLLFLFVIIFFIICIAWYYYDNSCVMAQPVIQYIQPATQYIPVSEVNQQIMHECSLDNVSKVEDVKMSYIDESDYIPLSSLNPLL